MSGQPSKPKDWFRSIFGRGKAPTVPITLLKSKTKEIILTPDILKEIGPGSPANNRIKTIQDMSREVMIKKLETNAVEALWLRIQDLTEPDVCTENRHLALKFLVALISGQYKQLGILREHLFRVIDGLIHIDDTLIKLELIHSLCDGGKDILYFEEHTGPCLVKWMPAMIQAGCLREFFRLLVGVIKFNAAYLDENVISGLIKNTYVLTYQTHVEEDLRCCLDVLDTVVCYSFLPTQSLPHFLSALCRIVNIPKFCNDSWELMRKLLGTHLGHRSIYTLCLMVQDKASPSNNEIKRAAIYYIGMALWGSKRVSSLKYSHTSVLPSFKQALLSSSSPIIEYEVCLTIQRLVKKYGKDIHIVTWDIVLDILDILLKSLETTQHTDGRITDNLHEIMTEIEALISEHHFMAARDKFFQLVEQCAATRPESSVIMLISHYAQSINPSTTNWLSQLYSLMEKYFRQDSRTPVRLKALNVLSTTISCNKQVYEDDLIEGVVLPHLAHIEDDPNTQIREMVADFIVGLCTSWSSRVHDLFGIVEKILHQPCKRMMRANVSESMECVYRADDVYTTDVQVVILCLLDLVQTTLYRYPPAHFLKVYDLLTETLRNQYDYHFNSSTATSVRKSVIEFFLRLRSDKYHRIGLYSSSGDSQPKFSPYIMCATVEKMTAPSSPAGPLSISPRSPTAPMVMRYTDVFDVFILCLENERDWEVMKTLIDGLPLTLQNKTLVLSGQHSLVDRLCEKICSMVMNKQQAERFQNVPPKFTRSDFHTSILPLLACLVSYHTYLTPDRQRDVVKCLEFGLMSKCAKICVSALRLASLEMQEVMMRLLPDVLLSLSKISATVAMAIPVLAFLSSLVRLPKMYANFIEGQYMCVFAIALPYTNPFKFSQFAVSLAHHVIATWFIHCRVPFRKGFVKFIQKGLWANVQQQFKENSLQALNQNSSDRSRAASYNEAALRRKRIASGPAACQLDPKNRVDDSITLYHIELTETCNEMMSRYVYGNYTNKPKRSPVVEFLLTGGASESWLLGNKLITITTSGRGNNVGKWGLCDKCMELCQGSDVAASKSATDTNGLSRRRHKSAAVSRSMPIPDPQKLSQDDINIRHSYSSVESCGGDETGGLVISKPNTATRDDAAVQTGRSLTEACDDADNIEIFLKNMKKHSSALATHMCNCWCTGWAEVYVRGPSGDMAWVTRAQNETLLDTGGGAGQDFAPPLADISRLFTPARDYDSLLEKINSESLEEAEYETLYESHFSGSAEGSAEGGSGWRSCGSKPDTLEVGDIASITNDTDLPLTHMDLSPLEEEQSHARGVMRKSRSSPSIIGSDDGLASSPANESSDGIGSCNARENHERTIKHEDIDDDATIFSVDADSSFVNITKDDFLRQTEKAEEAKYELTRSLGSPLTVKFDKSTRLENPLVKNDYSNDIRPLKSVNVADMRAFPKHVSRHERIHPTHRKLTSSKSVGSTMAPDRTLLEVSPKQDLVAEELDSADVLPDEPRRRVHTISVMSPEPKRSSSGFAAKSKTKEVPRLGINPCSVFLQLYQSSIFHGMSEKPLLLPQTEGIMRTTNNFDRIYPHETHKIGVIYVGPGQASSEVDILRNLYGSARYASFLEGLGSLISLVECDEKVTYIGGLDTGGRDGKVVYSWQDEVMHVIYHVATLMPNHQNDPKCNLKKLHIGNDFVTIVYNDSGEEYRSGTILGELNYVNIVIKPLDYESNTVTLQAKEVAISQYCITADIADILGHKDTKIVSDNNLALLVRQIAVHSNLASCVIQRQSKQPHDPFASNWLERLRQIKRIKAKLLADLKESSIDSDNDQRSFMSTDFTNYS